MKIINKTIANSSVSDMYTFFTVPDPGFFPNTDPDLDPDSGNKRHFFTGNNKYFVGNLFFSQKSRYFI